MYLSRILREVSFYETNDCLEHFKLQLQENKISTRNIASVVSTLKAFKQKGGADNFAADSGKPHFPNPRPMPYCDEVFF